MLHFPANVVEDVLAGQRPAIEGLRDVRPDLVPGTANLLAQVPAQWPEQVREFLRVRVLATTRDRRAVRTVIVQVELVRVQPATPLLARVTVSRPGPLGHNPGHVMSHDLFPPLRHRAPPVVITRDTSVNSEAGQSTLKRSFVLREEVNRRRVSDKSVLLIDDADVVDRGTVAVEAAEPAVEYDRRSPASVSRAG